MSDRYRAALIGFEHCHTVEVARQFCQHPKIEMVACADTDPAGYQPRARGATRATNKKECMEDLSIPRCYDEYRQMLDKERPQLVAIECESPLYPEVVEACAAAGAHVAVEKPMAGTMAEAMRMVRAAEAAGTLLLTRYNPAFERHTHTVMKLVQEGVIGRILECTLRYAHRGPLGAPAPSGAAAEPDGPLTGDELARTWWYQRARGGGALVDFCCYGIMYAHYFIGETPQAVMAMAANLNTPFSDSDDTAVVLVRYPRAIVRAESSWTTKAPAIATGPVLFGTEATIVANTNFGKMEVRLHRDGKDKEGELIPMVEVPEEKRNIAKQMIRQLEGVEKVHPALDIAFNLDLTGMLDAALKSVRSGRLEPIRNRHWES